MKMQLQTYRQLFSMMLVFGAIASLGISSIPNAFAFPDPGQTYMNANIVQGETAHIQIDQSGGEQLTISDGITVYNTDKNSAENEGSAGLGNCPDGSEAGLSAVDSWQLVRASDDAVIGYKFLADNDNILGQVTVKHGTGIGTTSVNTVKVFANTETILTVNGADVAGGAGTDIDAYWKIANGANVMNSDNVGSQSFLSCGTEGTPNYIGGAQVEIEKPIGGEILSINTSALVLAGLTTSAVWILPTDGTAIDAGLVLYKLRK